METIVISIGGSVLLSEDADVSYLKEFKSLIETLCKNLKIFLVVGGGKTARTYIKLGRKLNFKEELLDKIGIDATRVNAKLLAYIFETSNKEIPTTTDEAKMLKDPIVVMGGTTPGHSTDMVGAELAEKTGAEKFIIATNVDGVYNKDPNKFKDAKQIREISIKQLIAKYGTDWNTAGKNVVIDGPALKIIDRAKIPTYVLNGIRLDELEKAITNQSFNGTKIKE